MYILDNSTPDFRTINDLRGKKIKNHIHTLFAKLVKRFEIEEKGVDLLPFLF
jgi:hypothetical protein